MLTYNEQLEYILDELSNKCLSRFGYIRNHKFYLNLADTALYNHFESDLINSFFIEFIKSEYFSGRVIENNHLKIPRHIKKEMILKNYFEVLESD